MTCLQDKFDESKENEESVVIDFLEEDWEGFRHGKANDFDTFT